MAFGYDLARRSTGLRTLRHTLALAIAAAAAGAGQAQTARLSIAQAPECPGQNGMVLSNTDSQPRTFSVKVGERTIHLRLEGREANRPIGCKSAYSYAFDSGFGPVQRRETDIAYAVLAPSSDLTFPAATRGVLEEGRKRSCPEMAGLYLRNPDKATRAYAVNSRGVPTHGLSAGERTYLGCKFNANGSLRSVEIVDQGDGYAGPSGDLLLQGFLAREAFYVPGCPLPPGSYPETPTAIAVGPQNYMVTLRSSFPKKLRDLVNPDTGKVEPTEVPIAVRLKNGRTVSVFAAQRRDLGCSLVDKQPQDYTIERIAFAPDLAPSPLPANDGALAANVVVDSFVGRGGCARDERGIEIWNRNTEPVVVHFNRDMTIHSDRDTVKRRSIVLQPKRLGEGEFLGCRSLQGSRDDKDFIAAVSFWEE